MILTVCLNAAIDVTYTAERFVEGEANLVASVHRRAGGKGINVAETLHRLGVEVLATGLAGGRTGEAIRADLATKGIPEALVGIAGESRETVTVVPDGGGGATSYNEQGPAVSAEEWRRLRERFADLVRGARIAVLSGSVPPGIPAIAYAELAALARAHDVPVLLDATGEHLLRALDGGVTMVKPNRPELAQAVGRPCSTREAVLAAAEELRGRGAETAVVSLGGCGLLAVSPDGCWQARAARLVGNPVGAGDAVVAALATGMLDGRSWPDRLRRCAALSAAAAAHPVAGGFDRGRYQELLGTVRIEQLPRSTASKAG